METMTVNSAVLTSQNGDCLVLESVDVQASLRGLYSETVVTQVYRNLEQCNIEAVYTFPLPLEAVLLELTLELNGKILRGVVQKNEAAEERYEEAIEQGDSPVLLQQVRPGMFTMNVGNILPGEKALVRFRYGLLLRWNGDRLRLYLPTTIAPQYGNPAAAGLAPHQVPGHVLDTDHGFSLKLRIEGALANANFECPTHAVSVKTQEAVREISLCGGTALMNQDFVLVLEELKESKLEGLWEKDGDVHAVLAAFHPVVPGEPRLSPRCVTLLVDCSGSMTGPSITQAKIAIKEILSLLKPGDHFNLIKFGSDYRLLFPEPVRADARHLKTALAFTAEIDANMGGTRIEAAMEAAFASGRVEGLRPDVLLITDGRVWNQDSLVDNARRSGVRVFTVGVGNAVSEALLEGLAGATSGACEMVSPREGMAEHIVRHFQRMDQPMATRAAVHWPTQPTRECPDRLGTVFSGDTLLVFGWLPGKPEGQIELLLEFEDGREIRQSVEVAETPAHAGTSPGGLARVAAYRRLAELEPAEAARLAVAYQLVTPMTSCVLVLERDEAHKATEVPALRKVPHALPAGSPLLGGLVLRSFNRGDEAPRDVSCMDDDIPFDTDWEPESRSQRRASDADARHHESPWAFLEALASRYQQESGVGKWDLRCIADLERFGLDAGVASVLRGVAGRGLSEECVVVAFLAIGADGEYGDTLPRRLKRLIRRACSELKVGAQMRRSVREALADFLEPADEDTV